MHEHVAKNLKQASECELQTFELTSGADRFRAKWICISVIWRSSHHRSRNSSISYRARISVQLGLAAARFKTVLYCVAAHTRQPSITTAKVKQQADRKVYSERKEAMAAQDLLIFDAGEGLLGESSSSLFDCLDCETGVEDLLSDGPHSSQVSSPMSSHLMSTLTVRLAACLLSS